MVEEVLVFTRCFGKTFRAHIFPQSTRTLDHYNHPGILKQSAKVRCHLCAILGRHYLEQSRLSDEYTYQIKIVSTSTMPLDVEQRLANHLILAKGIHQLKLPMTLAAASTENPKVLNLARQWLHSCEATHELCRN